MAPPLTRRARYMKRLTALKSERSSWDPHWMDLGRHFAPRGVRFTSERNSGRKVNQSIINSTPLRAANTLAAGMASSISSPARPWFRLTTPDPEMAEWGRVRSYLHVAEERMRKVLQLTNVYKALAAQYWGLGVFGTDVFLLDEDDDTVCRAYRAPVGSYYLACSARGNVDTYFREHTFTVAQLVEKFGLKRCSSRVQTLYGNNQEDEVVEVLHVIEPNRQQVRGRADYTGMPFKSCWLETGLAGKGRGAGTSSDDLEDIYLRESGYWEFPVIAPRWFTTDESDVYGSSSPGMNALGDAKQLQYTEKKKGQMLAKVVDPPMRAPTSMRTTRATLLPAEVNFVDGGAGGTFEPAMVVDSRAMQYSIASQEELEASVDACFFADLWGMFTRESRGSEPPTATEIANKHEEKLLLLGPTLTNLDGESLGPTINRLYAVMQRRGLLPDPPDELRGVPLAVEYISIMAAAARMVGAGGVERLAGFVGNLAGVFAPGVTETPVTDKLNTDQLVDEMAGMLGVKPELVNTDEQVAAIRGRRAEAQQAQAMAAQAQAVAEGARTLSQADTGSDNMLARLVGPAAAASAG